ncbi:MAG: hypothetical protein GY754_25930 [bacterium]|nr:hypothetical protein [bacterium]
MQPDLSNIKDRIEKNRGFIDRITTKLPGYKGYVEKSERAEADKVLRQFIVDKIKKYKSDISDIMSDHSRKGETANLSDLDSLGHFLEKMAKKVEFADYVNAGSFSKMKISEEDQDRLLEYDWRMIDGMDTLAELVSKLGEGEAADFNTRYKDLKDKLKEFEKNFDDRKYVLVEVI